MKIPKAPCSLGDKGKKIWQETIKEMNELGIYHSSSLKVLEIYVQQKLLYDEAMAQVNDGNITTEYTNKAGATNIIKHPALAIAEKASDQVLKYANSLGLTPASLRRLNIRLQEDDADEFS